MASAGNFFETERKAFDLRTKAITANYTARVGGASDNFIVDRVINVTNSNTTANITVTVPAGKYAGQKLLVVYTLASGTGNLVISCTGTIANQTATGGYALMEWINSSIGWVPVKEYAGEG